MSKAGFERLTDGNSVLAMLEIPDVAAAQAFRTGPDLREVDQQARVVRSTNGRVWSQTFQVRS